MHTRVHKQQLCTLLDWRKSRMKIDEAIAHAREVAKTKYRESAVIMIDGNNSFETKSKYNTCMECAEEHEQLAEWLEELKMYKSLAPRELVSEKQKNDRAIEYSKGFDYGFKTGYEQAVDDFSKDVKELIVDLSVIRFKHIDDLAEQLKAGVTND